MHNSVRIESPIEIIKVTPLNPLISKVLIKVCYVGDEPNRNKSVITKDVARQLANSIPGSPIVGKYNEETEDFEEHNRVFEIKDGKFIMKDDTRPYGFVDLNANVWFQKYSDDGVVHEYLMTEGYLWTGQYPETKRIIEKGNNQSMELDTETIDAFWTKDGKGNRQFFIVNEAIMSKLCILGEDYEPCFEGASITKFGLDDEFKNQLFSLMNQMKEILGKGGTPMPNENDAAIVNDDNTQDITPEEPVEYSAEEVETVEEQSEVNEEPAAEENKPSEGEVNQYNLEEIPEYMELSEKYSLLETQYNQLVADKAAADELVNSLTEFKQTAEATIQSLTEFKATVERAKKQEMIDSFYMLSDEDKKDVIENINNYSLDDIEAKLSVICVRNRVSFNTDDEGEKEHQTTYSLNEAEMDDVTPAWVKAALEVAKKRN